MFLRPVTEYYRKKISVRSTVSHHISKKPGFWPLLRAVTEYCREKPGF
jgi:hypothetical protein